MGIHDRDYYQDEQLRPLRPWDSRTMVTMLIIVNVGVFVANFLFTQRTGAVMLQLLPLHSQDLFNPLQWYRFVTYGFAHDPRGITHILFNMLSLYFLGQSVEYKYGKWEFFRFYMISIVVCGLVWTLLRWGQDAGPLLGASGATTAVAMLFVLSFPHATLYLYGLLPVKAWVLGILIVIGNLFGSSEFVAYDVHLVGAGFAAIYFFGHWNFSGVGGWLGNWQTWARQKQRGLKVHRPDKEATATIAPSKDELESDRILDKIHREGKDSLTSRERAFLEKYSREMRKKRSQSE